MECKPVSAAVVSNPHGGGAEPGVSAQEEEAMAAAEQLPPSNPEPVLISRYPNRRLYDRSQARYVTLPEIAELVRQGRTVTVRDSKTNEDLTRLILTQIILEHYPERMELFPVSVLHSMIQANDTALNFLREYLQQSLTYLELLRQPAAVNPMLLPLHWMQSFLPHPTPGTAAPTAGADAATLLQRLGELERRLDEFQVRAGKSEPTKAWKEKTARKTSEPS
jgi:polyhydroxyalkanoate synthesis repressor PhaR